MKIEKKMLLCPVLGAALAIFLNTLLSSVNIDRFFPSYTTEVRPWLFRFPGYVGVLLYGVATPFMEEVIFRWLLFKRLCVYVTAIAAGAGSAVIFGIYHGNAVQFIYAFLFGLVLAYAFWRFDALPAPVLIHSAANIYVYVTYFYPLPVFFGTFAGKVILILLSGLVSALILMYFLNTAPEKNVMPEKPFFPK